MANLNETGADVYNWDEQGVYQLETTDPVQGGVDGIANRQAKELAVRTRNLHLRLSDREVWDIDTILGGIVADYNTLEKLRAYLVGLIDDIELGNVQTDEILAIIRGGISDDYNTLELLRQHLMSVSIAWSRLTGVPEFQGRAELTGNTIDWSGKPERYKAMTADTEFDASNLVVGKTIGLYLTGEHEATFASKFKKIVGCPDPDPNEVNYIQMKCLNATSGSELIIYSVMYIES